MSPTVGNQRSLKIRFNMFLWLVPLVLSCIGILMIISTTSPNSFLLSGTPFRTGLRQGGWLLFAFCVMSVIFAFPLRFWYRLSLLFLVLSWILCWVPFLPGIGGSIGGASRWIQLPGISVQPGELLCLFFAVHLAKVLTREEGDSLKAFVLTLALFAISILPLLLQPDFGSIVLIFIIAMGMYIEREGWLLPIFVGGCLSVIFVPVLIMMKPYRMSRIYAFWNPWMDPLGAGFQAIQGLIAFANGGLWGTGLGHGFQKLNYLPAAYTDFIFAAVGEELGFMGTFGILLLFGFWLFQTIKVYYRVPDGFMTSLTWGLALTVILPLVINVAGVTKLMPLTGMPLPFLSYGGTSLVMMWARVGILLRLEKESYFEEEIL